MLSKRKLLAFDRRGGAYLVLPWPDTLVAPATLRLGEERPAIKSEHLAAMRLVAPIARDHGLIHIATQVAMLRVPSDLPHAGMVRAHLLAHLVTYRWLRPTRPGEPAPVRWSSKAARQLAKRRRAERPD